MIDSEKNLMVRDLVKGQLTLRVIIWDVMDLDEKQTEKLEKELEIYDLCRLMLAPATRYNNNIMQEPKIFDVQSAENNQMIQKERYKVMQWLLREQGFVEEEALLVTEDALLAEYVYGRWDGLTKGWSEGTGKSMQERKRGIAVVYYEREDSGESTTVDMIVQGFEEIGVQFLDRIHKRRNGIPWNILYTTRTCVREITLSDLDEMYELYEGEGITDYTEPLFEREKEEEYTKSYISYMYRYFGYGMWVVRDRVTGKLLGRAGIEHHDGENDGEVLMELGYIIKKEYQNQGYATEVCKAILEYAREELQIDRLHCFIHPQNYASMQVAEKLGFLRCGRTCGGQELMIHFSRELRK